MPSPNGAPPGPFRPDFWRSPLRGPWLTAVLGLVLLIGLTIVIVTGLLSNDAYQPGLFGNSLGRRLGPLDIYLFGWPTSPTWLYALNQGLHVSIGLALVPVLLAKLWSVIPRLFEWPPVRSLSHLLERLSLALLVGGALFEFVTGIMNIQYWYAFKFDFPQAHYYGAWVFIGAFVAHVCLKFGTMRRGLKMRREVVGAGWGAGRAPLAGVGVAAAMVAGGSAVAPEPAEGPAPPVAPAPAEGPAPLVWPPVAPEPAEGPEPPVWPAPAEGPAPPVWPPVAPAPAEEPAPPVWPPIAPEPDPILPAPAPLSDGESAAPAERRTESVPPPGWKAPPAPARRASRPEPKRRGRRWRREDAAAAAAEAAAAALTPAPAAEPAEPAEPTPVAEPAAVAEPAEPAAVAEPDPVAVPALTAVHADGAPPLTAPNPAPPTMSRRALLGTVAAGSVILGVQGAAQSIGGPFRSLAFLLPRGRTLPGPLGFPINKTAAAAGITVPATGSSWRLEVVGERTTILTRELLLAMPQHTYELPIACVEGWSTTQHWTGVRLRDLAVLAGVTGPARVYTTSLDPGTYGRATLGHEEVADPRSLLALRVNGIDLSLDHGYPARVISPAIPGVHCTKWVSNMKFTGVQV